MNKALTCVPTLIALTLSTTMAMAQVSQSHTQHTANGKNRQQIAAILARQQAAIRAAHAPAAKTTTASERLIASSSYNFDAATGLPIGKTDSATFKYSGDHGSRYNRDMMSYMYPSGSYFSSGYPLVGIQYGSAHTSVSDVDLSDISADSTTIWNSFVPDLSGGYSYGISELVNETRDANNRVTFCSDQQDPAATTGTWDHYINTYDASHNIISSIDVTWMSSSWDTMSRVSYTYNTSNQLIQDSTDYWAGAGTWTSDSKNTYTYNSSGDLTYSVALQNNSGTWEERGKTFITYNTDHTVHTDSMSQYTFSATWEPTSTDSFGYTSGVDYWTYFRMRSYGSPDIEDYITTKHVSASGLPDTLYAADHNTAYGVAPSYLTSGMRAALIYDTYNNPVAYYSANYDITDSASGAGSYSTVISGKGYYYYEPYTTSGIKNITEAHEAMSIYPNPAANELKISRPSAVKGAYTTINFTNALGQIIRSDNMPWMNETETFSLAGFAPGMYIVTLQDKNGSVLSTQKIIKQ